MYADTPTDANQTDSQVLHPGSRKLFRHWESLRSEAACPTRRQLELRSISAVVPNLFILEQVQLLDSFRFRLAGTAIADMLGHDPTGNDLLQGWDDFEQRLLAEVLTTASRQKQPALIRLRLKRKSQSVLGLEIIALPFVAHDGQTQLIGGIFAFTKPPLYDDPVVQRELITVRTLWTEHGAGDTLLRAANRAGAPLLRVIKGGLG